MSPNRTRSSGFTLLELSISLVIITLIAGALVSVTWAVASGWQASDSLQSIRATTRQVSTQLYYRLRAAAIVGLTSADNVYVQENGSVVSASVGGSCMLWGSDGNGDGKIQWGEITLLQRDPATNTLRLYSMRSTEPKAVTNAALGNIQSSKDADDFKNLAGVTWQLVAHDVTAASFKAYDIGAFPQPKIVEFVLTFNRNGQVRNEYGTPSLRSALAGSN